jgi:hypothetical protein
MYGTKCQKGFFNPTNSKKYLGKNQPYFRSSWERLVMEMFDKNPNIKGWDSECLKIPYQNPFTGKYTVYVPDFVVTYVDAKGNQITEIIEVKPAKETFLEQAKSQKAKAAVALNTYKWAAAMAYAKERGLGFRIMTEHDIFHNPKGKA